MAATFPLKKIVVGGGTGFIGRHLVTQLETLGAQVFTVSRMPGVHRLSWDSIKENGLPSDTDGVVNLAGQNVFQPGAAWTEGYKQNVYNSRVYTTATLAEAILKAEKPPKVFAQISGVGYYPTSETATYTEESRGGKHDFFSRLCDDWESAGARVTQKGVRHVIIRSGVVLGSDGGILRQMYIPFILGLGGPLASGNQYMPWIHVQDLVNLFTFALGENVQGVFNGVAPQIITNMEFTKAFGRKLSRPTIFRVPKMVLDKLFNPERAVMMTEGQKVIPKRTLEAGFRFMYPDIDSAMKSMDFGL